MPFLPVCCRDRAERVLAVRVIRDYVKPRMRCYVINPSTHDISKWTLSYSVECQQRSVQLIAHQERKQLYANSCGACALLVAAKELGIEHMPVLKGFYSEFTGGRLALTNECESDLYKITSNSTSYRDSCSNLADAGYSMPQGIVVACRILGMGCDVTEEKNLFSKALSWLYPEVKAQCQAIGVQAREGIREDFDKYRLKAMAVSFIGLPVGLHWVLQRPDGSFMDPGVGKNSLSFDGLVQNARSDFRFAGYYDTGISIVLSA